MDAYERLEEIGKGTFRFLIILHSYLTQFISTIDLSNFRQFWICLQNKKEIRWQ